MKNKTFDKWLPLWLSPKSLAGRLLWLSGLWTILALSAGGLILSAVFKDSVEQGFNNRLEQTLIAMVGATEVANDGLLDFTKPLADQQFLEPYSGRYWQISSADQTALRSRSLWDFEIPSRLNTPALSSLMYDIKGPDNQTIRIFAQDITLADDERVYRYIVAGDLAELNAQIDRFDRILLWSLGAMGLGLLTAMILQVTVGLKPLGRVKRALAAIRSGKEDRLSTDYPPEMMPLVDEVNAVLDYNKDLVERARTQVGNLAHALKTPLSVMTNECGEGDHAGLAKVVDKQTSEIRRHVEHYLSHARIMGRSNILGVQTHVRPVVEGITRTIAKIYPDKPLSFAINIDEKVYIQIDRQDLDEILGNLIDNAAIWTTDRISILAKVNSAKSKDKDNSKGNTKPMICLEISDNGPGVSDEELKLIVKRGKRLDETKPGSGLGLSIVKDIVEMSGGQFSVSHATEGGLKVSFFLPGSD